MYSARAHPSVKPMAQARKTLDCIYKCSMQVRLRRLQRLRFAGSVGRLGFRVGPILEISVPDL